MRRVFKEVISNLFEIGCPLLPSTEAALRARLFFSQALLKTYANGFMGERFSSVDLREALFDFPDEPVIIIDKRLNCGTRQSLRVYAPLVSKARELRFDFRR